ncbi:hypothetical protein BBJ29_001288 [Phytophthora kernoviae]|uniref:MULE transposase domain-containing protein n=1 Tax=Phytophthora kernoviae TaxID=325452 RepID=A0A3R7GQ81_9STRA|nr:hypothetical protein BBJ29_001288 [Phytophthora kernoviae]
MIKYKCVCEHTKRKRGVQLALNEAYCARHLILDDLYGSSKDGYQQSESLVQVWKVKNPTSIVDYAFNSDGEFVHAFISHPYASNYTENGQKWLVSMEFSCKMGGIGIFTWSSLVETGMTAALKKLGVTNLRYCTHHIYQNIQDTLKGGCPPDMEAVLYHFQAAKNAFAYKGELNKLALMHPDVATYIHNIDPEHLLLYTARCLYGWRSINFVEPENDDATESCAMLPFQL